MRVDAALRVRVRRDVKLTCGLVQVSRVIFKSPVEVRVFLGGHMQGQGFL